MSRDRWDASFARAQRAYEARLFQGPDEYLNDDPRVRHGYILRVTGELDQWYDDEADATADWRTMGADGIPRTLTVYAATRYYGHPDDAHPDETELLNVIATATIEARTP